MTSHDVATSVVDPESSNSFMQGIANTMPILDSIPSPTIPMKISQTNTFMDVETIVAHVSEDETIRQRLREIVRLFKY